MRAKKKKRTLDKGAKGNWAPKIAGCKKETEQKCMGALDEPRRCQR